MAEFVGSIKYEGGDGRNAMGSVPCNVRLSPWQGGGRAFPAGQHRPYEEGGAFVGIIYERP